MKAFVTGGTDFIGKEVVRKLLQRGDQVVALVRSPQSEVEMRMLGADTVHGDITDPDSFRDAMAGSDVVFHIAGWYEVGNPNVEQAERVNVDGSRIVLGLAYQLGIPKIIYTSTIAVFGDTGGKLVDESYRMPDEQPFLSTYDRTKWEAHYRVAEPLIEKGAPIIILMPGAVYGPDDHSLVGELMHRYYRGQLLVFPAPDMTLTFAYVDDVAEAHLLAADKGKPGESYIIAGPARSLREMTQLWSQVSGVSQPVVQIPAKLLKPFAPIMEALNQIVSLPPMLSGESVRMLDASYIARADKARAELDWKPRSLEDGMRQTFEHIARVEPPPAPPSVQRKRIASFALGAALGLLLVWMLNQRNKRR